MEKTVMLGKEKAAGRGSPSTGWIDSIKEAAGESAGAVVNRTRWASLIHS